MKDLITTIPAIPKVVFSVDPVKIQAIKDEYPLVDIPVDLGDKDSYELVVKAIRVCRESRGEITKEHKEFKKPFLVAGKTCDTAKNTMLADLQEHENAWKQAKTDFDDIEKKRLEAEAKAKQEAIDKTTTKIAWINAYSSRLIGKPSSEVYEAIEHLKADDCEWAGDMIESAKNVIVNVGMQLENLHKMQVENENAERLAEEERVEREAKDELLAKERAIEQKRIDEERAELKEEADKLQAEKDTLQADKDKIEREKREAEEELKRLKAEKVAEEERVEAEKLAEQERIEAEKAEEKRKSEQEALEKKERIKTEKAEKAQVKKLAKEAGKREKETLETIVEILRSEKPAAVLASEILGKIKDGTVPNLFFK